MTKIIQKMFELIVIKKKKKEKENRFQKHFLATDVVPGLYELPKPSWNESREAFSNIIVTTALVWHSHYFVWSEVQAILHSLNYSTVLPYKNEDAMFYSFKKGIVFT